MEALHSEDRPLVDVISKYKDLRSEICRIQDMVTQDVVNPEVKGILFKYLPRTHLGAKLL